MMPQEHPLWKLKRYELVRDAAYVAELRAELYGDEYVVIECGGGLGFAVVRSADLPSYNIQPWQVAAVRATDLADTHGRRMRLSEMLYAATANEQVAS
jgi:hypothetical protein